MTSDPDRLISNTNGAPSDASGRAREASPFDSCEWYPMSRQPLSARSAYDMEIVPGVTQAFAAQHGIAIWVAHLLIPPILADLAVSGDWSATSRRRMVAVRQLHGRSLCHGLIMGRNSQKILSYDADHSEADCPRSAPELPSGRESLWLGPPGGRKISVSSGEGWRVVLRTASCQRVRLTKDAVYRFTKLARMHSGRAPSPKTFAHDYVTAADRLDKLSASLPEARGRHSIVDDTDPQRRLLWRVAVTEEDRAFAYDVVKLSPRRSHTVDIRHRQCI